MVKLARNEQCITLYPLTAHYSIGPFPTQVIFQPSQGPLILGLICSIQLHMARYCHFLLVDQIQPVVTAARLRTVNTLGRFHVKINQLGCFHRVIKYVLLTARYGPRIVRPMIGEMMIRPVKGPWILRPI